MIAMMTMGNDAQEEIIRIGTSYMRFISFTLVPLALSAAIGTSFREIARHFLKKERWVKNLTGTVGRQET
jgi:Na+-driven multidrug efflux pump